VFESHIGSVMSKTNLLQIPPKVICQKTNFRLPMVTRKLPSGFRRLPLPHEPGKMMAVYKAMAGDDERNGMIVDFVARAYAKGRNIIVFSDLKEAHLERLFWMAVSKGIPKEDMSYYVGGMSDKARETAKKKRVLWATYAMTAEATDIPWLDTAVFATPRANVVQTVGRILREWPDKKEPVVYDLVDGCSEVLLAFASKRRTEYYKMNAKVLNV
jgi:superfamily II DNA or RNA helicase